MAITPKPARRVCGRGGADRVAAGRMGEAERQVDRLFDAMHLEH
jgi:hypothetical protein